MADHTIKLSITSIFKGEGFKKARAAIKDVNSNVRQGASAISLLASNIGMLDTKYAKATSAITGMITALTTGTPALMALQVGITAVAAVVGIFQTKLKKLNEEIEHQKEIMKNLEEGYAKAFSEKLDKQMSTTLANVASISKELKITTEQANEFTAAMNKLSATRDAGSIIQLKIEKLLAVDQEEGATAELVAAKKDYEIVLRQAAAHEKQAQDAIDVANQKRLDAQSAVEAANVQLAEIDAQMLANSKRMNQASERNTKVLEDLAKAQATLKDKRSQIEAEREKAERAIITAQYAVAQAEEEAKNVAATGKLERLAAEKQLAAKEKQIAEEEADFANFLAEQRRKLKEATDLADFERIIAERAALEKEATALQNKANKATSDLEKAQREYADALSKWNANLAQNLTNEKIQAFTAGGGLDQIGNRLMLQDKGIQNAAAEAAIAAGIADGSIRTMDQANRAGRDAARAARDYASSKQARQEAQDAKARADLQKEADRLAATGRKLDPRKQAELDRLNKLQAGKDAAKNALDAAKKAEAEAKLNLKKLADETTAIRKKLDALGLK